MWISVLVISLIGILAHFLYELSNHNKVVGLFTAVNESTWEHIKIVLTPLFLFGLFDGFRFGTFDNYFIGKSLSVLLPIIFIPIVFYTYRYFTKKHILMVDISIFLVSIILAQMTFYYFMDIKPLNFIYEYIGTILLFTIFAFYMVLTLKPMKNFLFKDPITKKYGLKGHSDVVWGKNDKRNNKSN